MIDTDLCTKEENGLHLASDGHFEGERWGKGIFNSFCLIKTHSFMFTNDFVAGWQKS